MHKINRFIFKYLLGLIAILFASFPGKGLANDRPNIIFFIADDMTRDMFNCLPESKGRNLTPNLDKLVDEGTILMGQHVSATVCTPSRFNCITGKYASRASNPEFLHETKKNQGQTVVSWNSHVLPGEQNVASLLNAAGYFTGAVGKNHVIEVEKWKKIPLTADASKPKVMTQQRANYKHTIEAYKKSGFDYADGIFYENPDFNGPRALAVHNLDWTTEAALKFLDQADEDPFFLYFATTLPHGPQDAKRAWNADRKITPIGKLDKAPDVLPDQTTIPERLKKAGLPVKDSKANLLWMDDALGALIAKLKETGAYDNTIIFFFNDHGQYAKGSVFQGATQNPSIVWKNGGFKVGSVCNELVSNIDFTPTIMELAGQNSKQLNVDGKSFASVLNGKKEKVHESLYFEIGYTRGVRKGDYKYMALRYPDWVENMSLSERKQILKDYNKRLAIRGKGPNNEDPKAPFGHVQIIPGGGDAEFPATKRYKHYSDADQLYNLDKDPGETTNLANNPEYKKILKEMKKELAKYLEDLPGNFGELK